MPEDGATNLPVMGNLNNSSANKEFITTNLLVFLGISIVVGITFFLLSLETFSQNVDLIFLALLSLSIGLQSSVIIWPLIQNIPSLSNSTMFSWDNDSWAFLAGSNMIFQISFGFLLMSENPGLGNMIFFPDDELLADFLLDVVLFNLSCSVLLFSSIAIDIFTDNNKQNFVPVFHNPFVPSSFICLLILCDLILYSNINSFLALTMFMIMFSGLVGWIYSHQNFSVSNIIGVLFGMTIFCMTLSSSFPIEFYDNGDFLFKFQEQPGAEYTNFSVGFVLIVSFITLIGTSLNIDRTDQMDSKINYSKWNIMILTLVFVFQIFTVQSFSESIIHFILNISIIMILSILILDSSQFIKLNGKRYLVHRILTRDTEVIGTNALNLDLAILGGPASGKSSYAAGLYTMLKDMQIRDFWWSNERIDTNKEPFVAELEHLENLANRGRRNISVVQMFEGRIAQTTCNHLGNKFPEINSDITAFPIRTEAFASSEGLLEEFKSKLTSSSASDRALLNATTINKEDLRFDLIFTGEVDEFKPKFISNLKPGKKRTSRRLELTVNSPDIVGGSFNAAITALRNKIDDNKSISKSNLLSFKVDRNLAIEWGFGASIIDNPDSVNWVIDRILRCPNLILVADAKELVDGKDKYVENFLSLLTKLHRKNFTNTTSLTVLLNKADEILGDKNEDGFIEEWSDMNNPDLAEGLVNRFTNSAYSDLKSTGLDCSVFLCCSFGGLFTDEDGDRPMYPMVPVNVLEPLIELILGSSIQEA